MNLWRRAPAGRHLAAILAADVAGYARLMSEDEDGTLAGLRAWRHQVADPRIREYGGRIIKSTGDGFLAEFPSVVDAVRCAVEMQRAMVERNFEIPAERRIEFRFGLNLGDIVAEEHDIFGDGVNVAARLEALAKPSGICISETVRDHIRDKLPYVFTDCGEQLVKNISRPLRVFEMTPAAIAATELVAARQHRRRRPAVLAGVIIMVVVAGGAGTAWWAWLRVAPTPVAAISTVSPSQTSQASAPRLSIVVLPFENLSHDPDQDYFADAITEDLTTDLSRIAGSFVIGRNTAFTYKGKSLDPRQIGRELGVRYVLEGSVRRVGDQVEVNVQLIDTDTAGEIWADRFVTDRRNLAEAQEQITGRLARTLNLELVQAVGKQIEHESNPDAQDLIMRGWALYQRTPAASSRDAAKREFEQALKIDPDSYDAKLGVASCLIIDLSNGNSEQPAADEKRAEALLSELLARNPNRSQLHTTLALLRRFQDRLPESKIEWQRAIELDPNNSAAIGQLGVTLIYLGDPAAAIPLEEKRIRLNPEDPNIALAYWALGLAHLLLGETDEAVELLTKACAANPRVYYFYLDLAAGLALQGHLDEAHAALAESLKLKPEINSMARQRARWAYAKNPAYVAFAERTVDVGLRKAGMPEN